MDQHFAQWKKHCFSKVDLSKKGSVDEEIYPVVSLLNGSSNFFTTSSCSGRIILIDGNAPKYKNRIVLGCSLHTRNVKRRMWTIAENNHNQSIGCDGTFNKTPDKTLCKFALSTIGLKIDKIMILGLQKASGNAVFKFEPFVLHVQCKDLESAKQLHSVAINSGFRNSGVSIGKKGKIMMAVRSTHCLEVPLSFKGEILVKEDYIHFLVQTANQKMTENFDRIKRFFNGLQTALQADESLSNSTGKDKTTKAAQKWHQTKSQDLVAKESKIVQNSDSEDYLDTSLIFS